MKRAGKRSRANARRGTVLGAGTYDALEAAKRAIGAEEDYLHVPDSQRTHVNSFRRDPVQESPAGVTFHGVATDDEGGNDNGSASQDGGSGADSQGDSQQDDAVAVVDEAGLGLDGDVPAPATAVAMATPLHKSAEASARRAEASMAAMQAKADAVLQRAEQLAAATAAAAQAKTEAGVLAAAAAASSVEAARSEAVAAAKQSIKINRQAASVL